MILSGYYVRNKEARTNVRDDKARTSALHNQDNFYGVHTTLLIIISDYLKGHIVPLPPLSAYYTSCVYLFKPVPPFLSPFPSSFWYFRVLSKKEKSWHFHIISPFLESVFIISHIIVVDW